MDPAPTYSACLTPPGRGAIAVLAVRGPRAWEVTRMLFQLARPRRARESAAPAGCLPETPPPGRFWFGRLGAELRDEVVLAVKQSGAAPWLEVQCHGGPEVVRLLQETYAGQGVQPCTWQELEQFGPAPTWQQEVLSLLVQAPTVRTAAILLDQYQGAFIYALAAIITALDQGEAAPAHEAVSRLASLIPLGMHLIRPWQVVVAGAPNVGKSSLVNALAGYTRSLVSPVPGTTRDLVSTTLAIDGWPVELIDTAGLHEAADAIEGEGITRARRAIAGADLKLWVLDGSVPPVFPVEGEVGWQHVINKVDLTPAWNLASDPTALQVSARTKAGLDELCERLSGDIEAEPPAAGEAVPCTREACAVIEQTHEFMQAGEPAQARALLASFYEPGSMTAGQPPSEPEA